MISLRYDPAINPGIIDAFAAAAFRFGHSLLPTAVERWSKSHKFIGIVKNSNVLKKILNIKELYICFSFQTTFGPYSKTI